MQTFVIRGWEITAFGAGWLELCETEQASRLRARVLTAEREGRWAITSVTVTGDLIDSKSLKAFPVARIEAVINCRPEFAAAA